MLLGTRGGDYQPQMLLQMAAYLLWAEVAPAEAQRLPRWATGLDDKHGITVNYEPLYAGAHCADLVRRGHQLEAAPGWMGGWGPVSLATAAAGEVMGAADPRVATTDAATSRNRTERQIPGT